MQKEVVFNTELKTKGPEKTVMEACLGCILSLEHSEFERIRQDLLKDRDNIEPTPTRKEALKVLHQWLTFPLQAGYQDEPSVVQRMSPLEVNPPKIPSIALVEADIVTDVTTIRKIKKREEMRKRREKGPPENNIKFSNHRVESKDQKGLSAQDELLFTQLSHTETSLKYPRIEYDVEEQFVMINGNSNDQPDPELIYASEDHVPHSHVYVEDCGQWFRIDKTTHPEYEVPTDIDAPQPRRVPDLATNEDIATHLVLYRKSVEAYFKLQSITD